MLSSLRNHLYNKPTFYLPKPKEEITTVKVLELIQVTDGDIIDTPAVGRLRLKVDDFNYDPYRIFIEVIEETTAPNPNYEYELASWKRRKQRFDNRLKEWESKLRKLKKEDKKKQEDREKAIYLQLKEKFDK